MEYVEGRTLRELLGELEAVPEELCRHSGRETIHEAGRDLVRFREGGARSRRTPPLDRSSD